MGRDHALTGALNAELVGAASCKPRSSQIAMPTKADVNVAAPPCMPSVSLLIDRGPSILGREGPEPDGWLTADAALCDSRVRVPLIEAIERAEALHREVVIDVLARSGDESHPARLRVAPFDGRNGGGNRGQGLFTLTFLDPADATGAGDPPASVDLGLIELTVELAAGRDHIALMNAELAAKQARIRALDEELELLADAGRAASDELKGDNDALLNTNVAVLFLDRNLCIRWFTPTMTAIAALRQSDIGRPAADLALKVPAGDLSTDAAASLIHMRIAAVGIVKIDRAFVHDQATCPENATIIAAMVDLCRRLDKIIIVEGIETAAQRAPGDGRRLPLRPGLTLCPTHAGGGDHRLSREPGGA